MQIKTLEVGPLSVNCYIVWDEETKDGLVIDPGGHAEEILAAIAAEGVKVHYIVNTHGHGDHIGANQQLRAATGAPLVIHPADREMLESGYKNLSIYFGTPVISPPADRHVQDGDTLPVGKLTCKILHTPGHTQGSICLACGDALFSGDTLFAESIGRTDLPGGDFQTLLRSIKEKLFTLPADTKVYPGHGPFTTIGEEAKNNPYVR